MDEWQKQEVQRLAEEQVRQADEAKFKAEQEAYLARIQETDDLDEI